MVNIIKVNTRGDKRIIEETKEGPEAVPLRLHLSDGSELSARCSRGRACVKDWGEMEGAIHLNESRRLWGRC